MAPDLLSLIHAEIDERLDGLRPLLAEHEQLLAAVEALEINGGDNTTAPATANGAARRRAGRAQRSEAVVAKVSEVADDSNDGQAKATAPKTPRTAKRTVAKTPRATKRAVAKGVAKPARAVRGAAREAILGALEHGSHTVGELAVVTAMTAPNLNGNLRRLAAEGVVVKTEREGKAAWALVDPAG